MTADQEMLKAEADRLEGRAAVWDSIASYAGHLSEADYRHADTAMCARVTAAKMRSRSNACRAAAQRAAQSDPS